MFRHGNGACGLQSWHSLREGCGLCALAIDGSNVQVGRCHIQQKESQGKIKSSAGWWNLMYWCHFITIIFTYRPGMEYSRRLRYRCTSTLILIRWFAWLLILKYRYIQYVDIKQLYHLMFQVSFFHSPCRLFFISPNPMLVKRSPLHKNNNKNILVAEGLWNLGGLEWLYHAMLGHQAADTNHCRSGQGEFFFARLCVVMSRWAMDDYFPY